MGERENNDEMHGQWSSKHPGRDLIVVWSGYWLLSIFEEMFHFYLRLSCHIT